MWLNTERRIRAPQSKALIKEPYYYCCLCGSRGISCRASVFTSIYRPIYLKLQRKHIIFIIPFVFVKGSEKLLEMNMNATARRKGWIG